MECDVFYCAWFCDKCKWHDRQSVVKTVRPGDVVLPMNSMPSSSAAPFMSREHVKKRGSEGKRQRETGREQRTHQLQCSRAFVLFRIHLKESQMLQLDHKVGTDMAVPPLWAR